MRALLSANHVLIALFGLSSGGYKLFGGVNDVRVFAHLGMSASAMAAFGAVQALAAIGTLPVRTRTPAALALAACNAVATAALFASGTVTFGFVSILFVAMAVAVIRSPLLKR